MKITGGKTESPAVLSSRLPNPLPEVDLLQKPVQSKKPPRRRSKGSGNGVRLRKDASGKRSSRPETPLLRWKFDEGGGGNEGSKVEEKESLPAEVGRRNNRKVKTFVSARKLAAGIWRMQLPEVQAAGERLGFQVRCISEGFYLSGFFFYKSIQRNRAWLD